MVCDIALQQPTAGLFACCPNKLTSLVLSAVSAYGIGVLDWKKVAQDACKNDIPTV